MKMKRVLALGIAAMLLTQSPLTVLAEELSVATEEAVIVDEVLEEVSETTEIADEIETIEEVPETAVSETEEIIEEIENPEEETQAEISGADVYLKRIFPKYDVTISKAESWGYQAAKITWTSISKADGYRLYVKPAGGSWKFVKETASTSYVHNGLTTGKEYTYYVRAFCELSDGSKVWTPYSDGVSVTPIPKRPTIQYATDTFRAATLTWTKSNGASGYRIAYRVSGTTKWNFVAQVSGGSKTSYTHTNLKQGVSYDYIMRAYRTVNGKQVYSRYSNVVSITIPKSELHALERDKVYTEYDVTGDGNLDEFFYTYDSTLGQGWIYIDGFCRGTVEMARGGYLYLCKFSTPEVFLINMFGQYGGNGIEAYRYVGGDYYAVNDFNYFATRMYASSEVWKVLGEYLYIKSTVYHTWDLETFNQAENAPVVNSRFKLSNGKFALAARTLTVVENKTYTAATSFSTSTSRTANNTSGVYVKKGQTVTVEKMYLPTNGDVTWYQIKVNGKTGWFRDSSSKLLVD